MKNFFKSGTNIAILSFLVIGLILSFIGPFATWCLPVGTGCFFIGFLMLGVTFTQKYKLKKEMSYEDPNLFDAREIDYDEDVYTLITEEKKPIRKKIFHRIDDLTPSIICYVIAVIFLFFTIRLLFF